MRAHCPGRTDNFGVRFACTFLFLFTALFLCERLWNFVNGVVDEVRRSHERVADQALESESSRPENQATNSV